MRKCLKNVVPLMLVIAGSANAQDLTGIGNVVIKLVCILYAVVPWILTILFILAGILTVMGSPENRVKAKKVVINAVVGAVILLIVTFVLTSVLEGVEFSDFNECWIGGSGPIHTTSTLPEETPPSAVAWVDYKSPVTHQKNVVVDLGNRVYFDGSDSSDPAGYIIAYQWSFGDGKSATGPLISHLYTKEGTYSAQLQVIDDETGIDTDDVEVVVIGP